MLNPEVAQLQLERTATILEEMGVGYWLDSGTLLAAVRDGAINQYDHDIDLRILPGQLPEHRMPLLAKRLWEADYRVIIQNFGQRGELICFTLSRVMLDLKFAYTDGNLMWVYCWEQPGSFEPPRVHAYPTRFFRQLTTVKLLGREYPAPSPTLEYLEAHYGPRWRDFKCSAEQAEMTDMLWDHMHNPTCAMSLEQLAAKRREMAAAPKEAAEKEVSNVATG